jgi:hypothetical protein
MADLQVMRVQLSNIRAQLLHMPVFSIGRPDSDDKADKQAIQLERISEQLQLMLRDLKRSDNFVRFQLENIGRYR